MLYFLFLFPFPPICKSPFVFLADVRSCLPSNVVNIAPPIYNAESRTHQRHLCKSPSLSKAKRHGRQRYRRCRPSDFSLKRVSIKSVICKGCLLNQSGSSFSLDTFDIFSFRNTLWLGKLKLMLGKRLVSLSEFHDRWIRAWKRYLGGDWKHLCACWGRILLRLIH